MRRRGVLALLVCVCLAAGSVLAGPFAYITNQGSHDVSVIDTVPFFMGRSNA